MNGDFFPLQEAFAEYLKRWYATIYPDTSALAEYVERGFGKAIALAPSRMVDAAEDMLKAYQKNNQTGIHGRNALIPMAIFATAKDFVATGADWGGKQTPRRLVKITDESPVYGYRQSMADVRAQVLMIAPEIATARSMASQFSHFISQVENRRFYAKHTFGQWVVDMPIVLENTDLMCSNIAPPEHVNLTMFACDLTLKVTIPYFDAPRVGEPNDGSNYNPAGYQVIQEVDILNKNTTSTGVVTESGALFE